METALVGIDVRCYVRPESIFKRAPSTTRTSLRFLALAAGPSGRCPPAARLGSLRYARTSLLAPLRSPFWRSAAPSPSRGAQTDNVVFGSKTESSKRVLPLNKPALRAPTVRIRLRGSAVARPCPCGCYASSALNLYLLDVVVHLPVNQQVVRVDAGLDGLARHRHRDRLLAGTDTVPSPRPLRRRSARCRSSRGAPSWCTAHAVRSPTPTSARPSDRVRRITCVLDFSPVPRKPARFSTQQQTCPRRRCSTSRTRRSRARGTS
jgi:hypothetical protein